MSGFRDEDPREVEREPGPSMVEYADYGFCPRHRRHYWTVTGMCPDCGARLVIR